jgi:hypothetical protein
MKFPWMDGEVKKTCTIHYVQGTSHTSMSGTVNGSDSYRENYVSNVFG